MTGDSYQANKYGFLTVIHKLIIAGPAWAHTSIFECAHDARGAWKATKGHSKGKAKMIWKI